MAWTQPRLVNEDNHTVCAGARAAHTSDLIGTKLYIFGGWNGKNALNDLHILDIDKMTWGEIFPSGNLPSPRNNHISAVVSRTKVFVHGGHDGTKWLDDLHILDTERCTWVTPSMAGVCPQARACHSLTRVGRKLVMFGGFDGQRCFNDVDVLDLDTMTWMKPNVGGVPPVTRNAHTMTAIGGRLFLFGGHSGSKHLRDLFVLDAEVMEWQQPETTGKFPPGLRGHSSTLIGQTLFIFGGYDGRGRSNDLHLFHTETMTWSHPASNEITPVGRQRHSATLLGTKRLLIFGGFDGYKWLNDLHVLDVGDVEASALNSAAVNQLIGNMRVLLNNKHMFSDVTFIVEDQPVYAHKSILCAQCAPFRAMLRGGMRESHMREIQMPGWSHTSFLAMMEFLYTGGVANLSPSLAMDVMGLADHFALDHLNWLCQNLLLHHIDVDNVCSLLRAAHRFGGTSPSANLKRVCLAFVIKHFSLVSETKGFEDLSQEPQLLIEVTRESINRRSA